jgi:hypothetical protein
MFHNQPPQGCGEKVVLFPERPTQFLYVHAHQAEPDKNKYTRRTITFPRFGWAWLAAESFRASTGSRRVSLLLFKANEAVGRL